jgi:uncharacterized repeat protein (TIGR01451 family)
MKKKLLFLAILAMFCFRGLAQAVAYPVPDLTQCDSEIFDLTVQTPIALGNQNSSDFDVAYFMSEPDAVAFVNPIPNTGAFLGYPEAEIFVRVTSATDQSFDITSFVLHGIVALDFNDVVTCSGMTLPLLNYGNFFTGPGGTGDILPAGTQISVSTTIYVYVVTDTCISESSFTVTVTTPNPNTLASLTACDTNGDGFETFNLQDVLDDLMEGTTGFEASFYETIADADLQADPINNTEAYTNISAEQSIVCRIDIDNCTWFLFVQLNVVECTANTIAGTATLDLNGDGCDANDTAVANIPVSYTDGTTVYTTYTDANGNYNFENIPNAAVTVNTGDIYNYAAAPASYDFAMPANLDDVDFCYAATQTINDVVVYLVPTNQARPGMTATYNLIYQNIGTTTLSGDISLEFDDTMLDVLYSYPLMAQAGNLLTLSYTNLMPFQTEVIYLQFNAMVPPVVNGGDQLTFTAVINPIAGDAGPNDNMHLLQQIVVDSYDPNDIAVKEGAYITEAQAEGYLTYTIRFQNTGTADALKVRIEDMLSDNLDASTFQPIAASHAYQANRVGNNVEFVFNDINLAYEDADEPASHGFVTYRVKPAADIAIGDEMTAQGHIYFDFNEAIDTNIVTTTVQAAAGVKGNQLNSFALYPNPASGSVTLQLQNNTADGFDVAVADVLGKTVLISHFSGSEANLDITSLRTGIYFVKMNADGKQSTKKLIVK